VGLWVGWVGWLCGKVGEWVGRWIGGYVSI
jgi:hypothetical protein